MARQEKPVDPAAGPLQAFAFDLRKVRADAGSPTYRALAKAAGYGVGTLSEAASGVRRPTLDVVLAYVGACHGDVELWRKRWHELDATPPASAPTWTGSRPAKKPVEKLETPVEKPETSAGIGARIGPLWRWKVAVFAVLAALVVGALGAFAINDPDPTRAAAAPGCPARAKNQAFTAVTYGAGARVRAGAARDASPLTTIPAGCTVSFVGYCIGEKIHDNTGGTPDVRWFELPAGGVVASGIVHGNPPPGLAPTHCPDDRPTPAAIHLTVGADPSQPGAFRLSATGTGLDIVGFAALYGPDSPRRWRQAGFTEETVTRPGFQVPWKLEPAAAGPDPVILVAAACLGGDGPTTVVDARSAAPGHPAVTLSPADRTAAATAACAYPA